MDKWFQKGWLSCDNCSKLESEKAEWLKEKAELLEKVDDLTKELASIKLEHPEPAKRYKVATPKPKEQSEDARRKQEKYWRKFDQFSSIDFGYTHVRGLFSQNNIDLMVQRDELKHKVEGSCGIACLWCSTMFHLEFIVHPKRMPERMTADIVDQITLRGVSTDYKARQLAIQKGTPMRTYLTVDDLQIFGNLAANSDDFNVFAVKLPFEKCNVSVQVRELGHAALGKKGDLFEKLTGFNDKHMLVCLNLRWLGVLRGGQLYLYNCHPSQPGEGFEYNGKDPAVLNRAHSMAELCKMIFQYGFVNEGADESKHLFASFFALENMHILPK